MSKIKPVQIEKMNNNEEENEALTMRYVIFELNNEYLAMPLNYVQEVLEITKLRKIARCSDKIYGIYNLRGEILPIINFHNCIFSNSEKKSNNQQFKSLNVLVVKIAQEVLGIGVDKIHDIAEFNEENFDQIPNAVQTRIPFDCIEQIVNYSNIIIKIIDIKKIISESLLLKIDNEEKGKLKQSSRMKRDTEPTNKIGDAEPISKMVDLSKDQLDALREISNIASGKAAIAMGHLFKNKMQISINVDSVYIQQIKDFDKRTKIKLTDKVLGIRASILNDLHATIFLILPLDQIMNLLDQIESLEKIPKNIESIDELDKNTKSALMEFGNIILSHYCAGMSDFLKIQVYHEVPQIAIDTYGALIDGDIAQAALDSDQVIFLQTQVHTKEKSIESAIVFIPARDSIDNFIKWLDVDNIVQLLEAESEGSTPVELQKAQTEKTKENSSTKSKSSPTTVVKPSSSTSIKAPATSTSSSSQATTQSATTKSKKSEPAPIVSNKKDSNDQNAVEEIFSKIQFQKDYKITDLDKKGLNVTDADLDTFRELGNIGAGNASNALSQMLNKKVYLEIPPAKVVTIAALTKDFADKNLTYIGYIGETKGFLESNIFLILETNYVENALQLIMESESKKTLKTESDLSANEKSAIIELLNILLGHYIAALADFLKILVDPPEYQFIFKKSKQLFSMLDTSAENKDMKAIIVETTINVSDSAPIKGGFIMILHPKIVQRIIEKINQEW